MNITENYLKIKNSIPSNITIVIAAKRRSKEEILEIIKAGATDIGYNYVQEAEKMKEELGENAKKLKWHLIGHLQSGKVNQALDIFDIIQTIDSYKIASAINKRTTKVIPVLIEINIAKESQKSGVFPENTEKLIRDISTLPNIKVEGIMTIGSLSQDINKIKNYFKETKQLFDNISKMNIPNVEMKTLSMGMSDSYNIAIEEGATIIRPGTCIFGKRIIKEKK
ncbi:MAG: YggS family pyridoxal phosphate-dependent enzyme [Candidatus Woesearchaeota archaeon]|jgi:hypothetical protein